MATQHWRLLLARNSKIDDTTMEEAEGADSFKNQILEFLFAITVVESIQYGTIKLRPTNKQAKPHNNNNNNNFLVIQFHAKSSTSKSKSKSKMSRVPKLQVDDDEFVRLLDLFTGRVIFNCTKPLAKERKESDEAYPKRFQDSTDLYVNRKYQALGGNSVALNWNEMANGTAEIDRQIKAFVQFACVIAYELKQGRDILVYCKDGRSRSPCVMAVFFVLFRGYSRQKTKDWFNEAFSKQRPATYEISRAGNFPNFERFDLVLEKISLSNNPENSRWYNLVRGKLASHVLQ